jgi:hypothetical protein
VSVPSSKLRPPPSSASKCVPLPGTKGKGKHLPAGEGVGGPNSDDWSLAPCLFCGLEPVWGGLEGESCGGGSGRGVLREGGPGRGVLRGGDLERGLKKQKIRQRNLHHKNRQRSVYYLFICVKERHCWSSFLCPHIAHNTRDTTILLIRLKSHFTSKQRKCSKYRIQSKKTYVLKFFIIERFLWNFTNCIAPSTSTLTYEYVYDR